MMTSWRRSDQPLIPMHLRDNFIFADGRLKLASFGAAKVETRVQCLTPVISPLRQPSNNLHCARKYQAGDRVESSKIARLARMRTTIACASLQAVRAMKACQSVLRQRESTGAKRR